MQNNKIAKVKERLSIGESAEYLGVSIDTLRRWEKKSVVAALRSPGGHRYFLKKDLDQLFGQKYARVTPPAHKAEAEEQQDVDIKGAKVATEKEVADDISTTKPSTVQNETVTETSQVIQKQNSPSAEEKKESPSGSSQESQVNQPVQSTVLIPPPITRQEPIQNMSNYQPVQQNAPSKKDISWTTIIIIGLILFTVIDLVLLIVYLTSSQPLATPVP